MEKITKLYFYGSKQYTAEELTVYLVWCQPSNDSKRPTIVPILAPICGDIRITANSTSQQPDAYDFPTIAYIKAAAKKAVTELIEPASVRWSPEDYKFCTVRMQFECSLQECINNKGEDVKLLCGSLFGFNDMLAYYVIDEGTIPVTIEAIKGAAAEVEGSIGAENEMTHNLPCPDGKNIH